MTLHVVWDAADREEAADALQVFGLVWPAQPLIQELQAWVAQTLRGAMTTCGLAGLPRTSNDADVRCEREKRCTAA